MAKTAGGVRTYSSSSSTYQKRQVEVGVMRMSGRYSSVEMGKGGGYVAIEKSTGTHSEDEIAVAKILADKGYKVILKDETPTEKGKSKIDGEIFSASYEQRTPTGNEVATVKNALLHAKDKKAKIALIYSKNHILSRETIDAGVKLFEEKNAYRFNKIIVVADNGHVHTRKHDTK